MHIYQCFLKIVMLETIYIEKCCIQLRKLLNRSIFTSGFRLKNPTVCSLTQMSELQPQIAQTSVIMVQCVNNECVFGCSMLQYASLFNACWAASMCLCLLHENMRRRDSPLQFIISLLSIVIHYPFCKYKKPVYKIPWQKTLSICLYKSF